MEKVVSTLNLSREEWLQYRKAGIGGSDAGAICGLNPYRTAMQVYQDKISDACEDIDKELLVVPDLLAFLCDCWMQSRDNSVEEMREYLQKEMIALCEKANGCDLTEGKGK